jgi:hypothetical protein
VITQDEIAKVVMVLILVEEIAEVVMVLILVEDLLTIDNLLLMNTSVRKQESHTILVIQILRLFFNPIILRTTYPRSMINNLVY